MVIELNALPMAQTVLRSQGGVISQLSFSDLEHGVNYKKAKREILLVEMDLVVPWESVIKRIEPMYPKFATGRPACSLAPIIRVYCM